MQVSLTSLDAELSIEVQTADSGPAWVLAYTWDTYTALHVRSFADLTATRFRIFGLIQYLQVNQSDT